LVAFVESLGQPAFRGRQILPWIYKSGIDNFSQMTDIAKEFRLVLADHAYMSRFTDPITQVSRDGAVKFAFTLEDGFVIEAVMIPEEGRNTLCVSSQAGCAMGCKFCLTGSMGFTRNLSTAEIVNQVCSVRDWILEHRKKPLTNIVFMGMGEPLANLDNLIVALSLLTEQRGLDFSSRRITVSTCGLVPQMLALGKKAHVNLAVSLHAPDNDTRTAIMPVNARYPLTELLQACRQYQQKKRQRIMFEYTLLAGINDSDECAGQLIAILADIPCKINLLSMNDGGDSRYVSPPHWRILAFQKILRDGGYTVFIRQSRGADILAACGQLAGEELKKTARLQSA